MAQVDWGAGRQRDMTSSRWNSQGESKKMMVLNSTLSWILNICEVTTIIMIPLTKTMIVLLGEKERLHEETGFGSTNNVEKTVMFFYLF